MGWTSFSRRRVGASLLLGLALLAGAARAVLPAGYMVNAGLRPGEAAIVLCAGHGSGVAALDLATGAMRPLSSKAPSAPTKPGADAPCVFAVAAIASPPDHGPFIAAPAGRPGPGPAPRFEAAAVGRGLAAPPPPATGPPVSRA